MFCTVIHTHVELCSGEFRALAVGMATTLRDDAVGMSTAVSVMSVVQSERQFSPVVDIRGCFTRTVYTPPASFFSGVYSWLVMTFNYLILWVRVKGEG